MEFITEIFNQIGIYISVPYFLTFILLSYLVKTYLKAGLEKLCRCSWKTVYTVLALATLTAVPFLIWTETSWIKIVFSYALGTSLHELIFRYIEKLFIRKK